MPYIPDKAQVDTYIGAYASRLTDLPFAWVEHLSAYATNFGLIDSSPDRWSVRISVDVYDLYTSDECRLLTGEAVRRYALRCTEDVVSLLIRRGVHVYDWTITFEVGEMGGLLASLTMELGDVHGA